MVPEKRQALPHIMNGDQGFYFFVNRHPAG
jgi:hypothetical protein